MPTNYPAIWSAVAATCSALSAFFVMLIQRRNLLESVRPDLIPLDWNHTEQGEGESKHELITFKKIRNIGRGAAFNVWIGSIDPELGTIGKARTAMIMTSRIPVIGPNETVDVNGQIRLWWKNAEERNGHKIERVTVHIQFIDTQDFLHTSAFEFGTMPLDSRCGMNEDLGPKMQWLSRTKSRQPIWQIRMASRIQSERRKLTVKTIPALVNHVKHKCAKINEWIMTNPEQI